MKVLVERTHIRGTKKRKIERELRRGRQTDKLWLSGEFEWPASGRGRETSQVNFTLDGIRINLINYARSLGGTEVTEILFS